MLSGQSTRNKVYEALLQLKNGGSIEIVENSSLIIKTVTNYNNNKILVDNGIMPYEVTIYRFKKEGNFEPLYTVSSTYYSKNRRTISMYSNESEPSRKDYETYMFSQTATYTHGPVLSDNNGLYYTTETIFNLE